MSIDFGLLRYFVVPLLLCHLEDALWFRRHPRDAQELLQLVVLIRNIEIVIVLFVSKICHFSIETVLNLKARLPIRSTVRPTVRAIKFKSLKKKRDYILSLYLHCTYQDGFTLYLPQHQPIERSGGGRTWNLLASRWCHFRQKKKKKKKKRGWLGWRKVTMNRSDQNILS